MESEGDVVAQLSRRAIAAGLHVAVAESLTGGELAAHLASGPDAASWFAGGVVAYTPEAKQSVLGVPPGPVVSRTCAVAMAEGVSDLLEAPLTVAVTGVGGPDPEEGQPAGTVWCAVHADGRTEAACVRFDGSPEEVVQSTIGHAARQLLATFDRLPAADESKQDTSDQSTATQRS